MSLIKDLREAKGMSRKELAERVGVSACGIGTLAEHIESIVIHAWNRRSSAKAKEQKNKMKQLAELFGKKIGEEFDVYYRESTDRCKFTDAGLFMRAENGKFIIADSTFILP